MVGHLCAGCGDGASGGLDLLGAAEGLRPTSEDDGVLDPSIVGWCRCRSGRRGRARLELVDALGEVGDVGLVLLRQVLHLLDLPE